MNFSPLKTALQTDPLGLGFAPLLDAGNYAAVAAICNDPAGKGAGTITLPTMANQDFVTAFLPHLLGIEALAASNPARERTYDRLWQAILAMPSIDFANANVSNLFALAVSDGLLTQAQATALNQRKGTYAEVLCGAGVAPTGLDISELIKS